MSLYIPTTPEHWQGRYDGDAPDLKRWHQHLRYMNLEHPGLAPANKGAVAILGFACDEGVRRNQGRIGAAQGPAALRAACASFPIHEACPELWDVGTVHCPDQDLEQAQASLGQCVTQLLALGYRPLLFGGGHEITYGHYLGLRQAYPRARIGIVNFDAHFDIRPVDPAVGPSSGTGFWQITQADSLVSCLTLGIQPHSNTAQLFALAKAAGLQYHTGAEFNYEDRPTLLQHLRTWERDVDLIYVTICMDVFAAAFAPGVSAPANIGILPDKVFRDCLQLLLQSPKCMTMDIAELNPSLDIDRHTARLAAAWAYAYVYRKL
jgi:formiminoglutamase